MAGLFEILGKIKAQPGMYLGSPSVENLFIFLVGYKTARRELGIEPTKEELRFYGDFQPWLQEKFKIRTNNSWAALIQFHSVISGNAMLLNVTSATQSTKPIDLDLLAPIDIIELMIDLRIQFGQIEQQLKDLNLSTLLSFNTLFCHS